MNEQDKGNIFNRNIIPSSLNDKPKNFGNNKKKNEKKEELNNGSSNKNESDSNDNAASENFEAINDYMNRNNSNEEKSEFYKDLGEDNKISNPNGNNIIYKMNEQDSEKIFGIKTFPLFLNDMPKNFVNNKHKAEKKTESSNGNSNKNESDSNHNTASENFEAINDYMNRNNTNEKKSELYKNLENENKNSNPNGNATKEYSNENTNKSILTNYNVTNNSSNNITKKSSCEKIEKRLNQNYDNKNENFHNNFDNAKNEANILNDYDSNINTSSIELNKFFYISSINYIPNSHNYSYNQQSIYNEGSILNESFCCHEISSNNYNNYGNIFQSNSNFNSDEVNSFDYNNDSNFSNGINLNNNNNLNCFQSNSNISNNEGIIYNINANNNPFRILNSNNAQIMFYYNENISENNNIINLDEDENENEINLNEINVTEFNYNVFYENYSNYYKNKYNYAEPRFIKPEEYIGIFNSKLKDLWTGQHAIFDNELDLLNRNGKIYNDLINFLANKKTYQHKKDRRFYSDNMSEKIKTQLNKMIFIPFNSYFKKEIKILYQTKKSKNNGKNDYNYVLLEMPIYSILSNNEDNKKNIQKFIENSKSNRKKQKHLLKFLFSKLEDCLDYFVFIKNDKDRMFNNENIVKYLKEEYKKLSYDNVEIINKNMKREKKIRNKEDLKDYIASLLLLAYNLKRLYYLKIGRGFKK